MPSFTEFLLAPWKIFQFLSPGSPTSGGGSFVCATQDSGGQLINLCQVGGYTMPAFVFWASSLIFLFFAVASVALLLQCGRVAWVLSQVSSRLDKGFLSEGASGITGQQLSQLRDVMTRDKLLARPWRQFEDQLLVTSAHDEVFTSHTPETALSRQALIEDHIATSFFNGLPGILTGLGLLMTFVAILDGLSHVSVSANMDVQGIGGLINGLSGKFVSSIVAVTCAVSFVFVERIAYSRPNEAYRRLLSKIDRMFRRRSSEHLLHQIQTQLQGQAAIQRELAQALAHLQGRHAEGPSSTAGASGPPPAPAHRARGT